MQFISPYKLLFPERLDITCKYLFFKEFQKQKPNDDVIQLYIKHIMKRTGGVEKVDRFIPDQPKKMCIDDYVKSAKDLFEKMSKHGFDSCYPIHYYENGIANGAHRIACSLVLQIETIPVKKVIPKKYVTWDEQWFIDNEFTDNEVALLHKTKRKLMGNI